MTISSGLPVRWRKAGQYAGTYDNSLRLGPRFLPIVLLLLAMASASLAVGTIIEFGVWTHEEVIRGPFRTESGSRTAWVPVGQAYSHFSCCVGGRPDDNEHPTASTLRAWLNGRELGPAHMLHNDIRSGKTAGFSHYQDNTIRFFIPESVANDQTATLRVRYPVQYSIEFLRLNELIVIVLALLAGFCGLASRMFPVLHAALRAGIITSAAALPIYIAFVVAGYATRQPVPAIYIFRYIPIDNSLNRLEPYLPGTTFALAILLVGLNWALKQDGGSLEAVRHAESQTVDLWRRFGLFSTAAVFFLFIAASAWSGHVSAQDVLESNIGGFVPQYDASRFFAGGVNYLIFGQIDAWNLRRPLATLFRSETVALGGLDFVGTILAQTAALSFAIYWATNAVVKWRGVAAGIVFWGMAYILFRPFAITTLTEPLALFWSLCSIPFFIYGLQRNSVPHLLVAVAFLFVALLIRMGAMFVIPFMVLWALLHWGANVRQRLRRACAASAVLLLILLANVAIDRIYGRSDAELGGNFASTLCGMSIGGTWSDCYSRYGGLKTMNEAQQADFLYRATAQNVVRDPRPFIRSMRKALRSYRDDLYSAPTTWYRWPLPSKMLTAALYFVALAGWIWTLRRGVDKSAMALVIFVALGIVTSVPFIYLADARRVLYATNPLLALLISGGFFVPDAVLPRNDTLKWQTGAIPLATAILLALLLPFGVKLAGVVKLTPETLSQYTDNDRLITGHKWQTGFIVLQDAMQQTPDVPSMTIAKFREFVLAGGQLPFAAMQNLPTPPFAVVMPFGLPKTFGDGYILPPYVFEDRSVQWWKLVVAELSPGWFITRSTAPIK